MMRRRARSAILPLLLAGCVSAASGDDAVEIRVENESAAAFDHVEVTFPEDRVDYGALAPGARTGYREVARAYRYARIEVHVPGDTLLLQPIDYVGEALLEPGRYTYVIGLDGGGSQLSLSLRPDG